MLAEQHGKLSWAIHRTDEDGKKKEKKKKKKPSLQLNSTDTGILMTHGVDRLLIHF